MNLFQKYGIKEVADVTFYNINYIGDEVIYTPVLHLDTLKVSTISKTAQKTSATGGKGNKKLISWSYGKEFSLNLEDALFTPASMSLVWSGKLNSKLSPYTSAVVKINIANKYGNYNYSTKAYPSPALTEDEWQIVFRAATEKKIRVPDKVGDDTQWYLLTPDAQSDDTKKAYIIENQTLLRKCYFNRLWETHEESAMPRVVADTILTYIDNLKKLANIETDNQDIEVLDRFERCVVKNKNGLQISTKQQKENLLKYYSNDQTSSYIIYYDEKTMLPLLHIEDGEITGWNDEEDTIFTLRFGTVYYKRTVQVKYRDGDEGSLGKVLVIDAETFPGDYRIVGETYIKEQKTGKNQRYQFVINRAQVSSDTSLVLQAEGEPTTFSMAIDVLTPKNGDLVELKQFDVDDDILNGGTRVVPQYSQYTYTNTELADKQAKPQDINNGEIF